MVQKQKTAGSGDDVSQNSKIGDADELLKFAQNGLAMQEKIDKALAEEAKKQEQKDKTNKTKKKRRWVGSCCGGGYWEYY